MSNIPPWYDYEEGRTRDDIWPFQKGTRAERRATGKKRLCSLVAGSLRKLPDGWSINWKASRRRTFRVNHTTKTIRAPFPAQYAGMAALSSAIYLAGQISHALKQAKVSGQVPAVAIKAWPFMYGTRFSTYYASNMMFFGVSWRSPAAKQAGIQSVKEVLRFFQSPDAWRVPRYKAGSPRQWSRPHNDGQTLAAIAHRKVLMEYLKVNDPAYPLPAIAKARLKKIQQSTQP